MPEGEVSPIIPPRIADHGTEQDDPGFTLDFALSARPDAVSSRPSSRHGGQAIPSRCHSPLYRQDPELLPFARTFKVVFGKCPHPDQFTLTPLAPGAIAESVTKVIYRKSSTTIVVKKLSREKAIEESGHIKRISKTSLEIFPKLFHLDEENGMYSLEFVPGLSLDKKLNSENFDEDISMACAALKRLHEKTKRPYISQNHVAIVNKWLEAFSSNKRINQRMREMECESFSDKFLLKISRLLETYEINLPEKEALIHGDAHLGNIIKSDDGAVTFIDPRVSWGKMKNQSPGYFDGLYDISCMAYSLISDRAINRNTKSIHGNKSQRKKMHQEISSSFLYKYLQRDPTKPEMIRYNTYIACLLIENMKYPSWTPDRAAFIETRKAVESVLDLVVDNGVEHHGRP